MPWFITIFTALKVVAPCICVAASYNELKPIIINSNKARMIPQSSSDPDVRLEVCRVCCIASPVYKTAH